MKKFLLLFILVITGTGAGWLASEFLATDKPGQATATPAPGGDFGLVSADGPVRLQDFRGKVVVIYFGYTFCPDICPISLALLTQALNELTADELKRVQALFVSIDPQRDTPEQLKKFTAYFHPKLLGATGTAQQVREIANRYATDYRRVDGESAGGYLVDHTSQTFLVDATGKLTTILPHATPPQTILTELRALLP